MKLIPMGEYYVWHCDWCDSTNYTIWSRMDDDNLSCAACHHHPEPPGATPIATRVPTANRLRTVSAGFAC